MARVEANPTPTVLTWARDSAGLPIELAAKKAAVTSERLAAWESGQQRPTFAQLRRLAEVYKRPLAIFYLKGPPRGFQPMHDFRRAADRAVAPNSPELTMEIRKAHDRREWALELLEQIEEQPKQIETAITLNQGHEAAAEVVRAFLAISIEQQSAWRTDYEALKQWRLLIENTGILTFQASDVDVNEARGFSISERPLPVAVANIKDAPRGRIFTFLHEVAHLLLRDGGICDLHESEDDEASRIEAFCNRVAGATLFPRAALLASDTARRHRRGDMAWSDDELGEISRQFGGSRETALVRLLTLRLTNSAFYREMREKFLKQYAEQRERQKGFALPHVVALASAGPTFASLVVESFNRERITASDVSDYLGIRLKHPPEIQRDYTKFAI
jgi:Zn-dependent peptidase ImmA (M78 family)